MTLLTAVQVLLGIFFILPLLPFSFFFFCKYLVGNSFARLFSALSMSLGGLTEALLYTMAFISVGEKLNPSISVCLSVSISVIARKIGCFCFGDGGGFLVFSLFIA